MNKPATRVKRVRRSKKSTAQPEANTPNIVFVGHRVNTGVKAAKPGDAEFLPREPITGFNEGLDSFKLPSAKEQLAGPFYHKEAGRIVRLFPKLYKIFTPKG